MSYYERSTQIIKEEIAERCDIVFKIQTNGTLINDRWTDLFKRHNFHVGVSIDGPAFLHDQVRRFRSREGTHEKSLCGIKLLQKANIGFNVICVLSDASLSNAELIYDFFRDNDISSVCFNIEETEGIHKSELLATVNIEERFSKFFSEYVRLVRNDGGRQWVREIDKTFQALFLAGQQLPVNQQVTPFSILTVASNGDFSTFSPELMGTRSVPYGNFIFGNVLTDSLNGAFKKQEFVDALAAIRAGVNACRARCEYFEVCGGGAPSNKYFENGRLNSTETHYCRTVVKATADILIDSLTSSSINPSLIVDGSSPNCN